MVTLKNITKLVSNITILDSQIDLKLIFRYSILEQPQIPRRPFGAVCILQRVPVSDCPFVCV